jgi:hypothetical protein
MHPLATDGAGHHLHRAGGIVAPAADVDLGPGRVAGGKQRGMPAEQRSRGHRCMAVGGGIEHHLDHAFDVAIHRGQRADVHAQPAGDGGAHGFDIELLALDLAGLDHVLGERREAGLVAQAMPTSARRPINRPLGTTDLGHGPASAARSKRQFGQSLACQMYL